MSKSKSKTKTKTEAEHRLVIDPSKDRGDLIVTAASDGLSCACGSRVWMDVTTPVCIASEATLDADLPALPFGGEEA